MGRPIASSKRFEQVRAHVLVLLPGLCRIYPPLRVISPSGTWTEELGEPLLYNGSPNIPCRLDAARFVRVVSAFDQELVTSEFDLFIPWDAPIYADHKVEISGQLYEVKRLMDADHFRVTRSASLVRINVGVQSPS